MSTPESLFRTLEVSDVAVPAKGLRFVTVKSKALQGRADLTLFLPSQAKNADPFPVVILLHGVYGSHWAWALKGKAHVTLQAMIDGGEVPPMTLVMPSDGLWGDGSGYLPHADRDFEKWIVDEVPQAVIEAVDGDPDAPHFIAGLSMGGFGALRLGAKYPERFRAFAGHSSITHFDQLKLFVEEPLAGYCARPEDQCVLTTMLANRERLPPFRFDCGLNDPLIEPNRELSRALQAAGLPFSYEEFPGGHEWPYWESHLRRTLRFFGSQV